MVRLIVLLGNKGTSYAKSRHNAGWIFGDYWSVLWDDSSTWHEKFHGSWNMVTWLGKTFAILKPMTFMNLSGQSVQQAAQYFKVDSQEILVIHDDIELEFRTVRLQQGGGLAGHNGLRSIRDSLKTDRFLRLRIGIGRPKHADVSSFVLSRFSIEEESIWPLIADMGLHVLESYFDGTTDETKLPII